jgi:hypothetical protein
MTRGKDTLEPGRPLATIEPTLAERAGRMYRQLLILQRLFHQPRNADDSEWASTGDRARDAALSAAITEIIDELTDHAGILTSIPFPLSEWQPGDGPDDDRWRALTEVERREVLSMVSAYENLIVWAEQIAPGHTQVVERLEGANGGLISQSAGELPAAQAHRGQALDYLVAERARVGRFRQELSFLDRRRNGG